MRVDVDTFLEKFDLFVQICCRIVVAIVKNQFLRLLFSVLIGRLGNGTITDLNVGGDFNL